MYHGRGTVYPQYELWVNGAESYVSLFEAARQLECHGEAAQLGDTVRESDGSTRKMTDDERKELDRLSREWASM